MNLLFLTIGMYDSIYQKGGYGDLLRVFLNSGHKVYSVVQRERRMGLVTELIDEGDAKLLAVKVGNITKTNLVEKGISTVLIGKQYKRGIEKYFPNIKFDLIIYTTPPITLVNLITYIKRRDNAKTYLLLKDIFPQNAVDIGMMSKKGIKGLLYQYFRFQEKKLYAISDWIGCMSQANVDYVLAHNESVRNRNVESIRENNYGLVEICPNCVEINDKSVDEITRMTIRKKYDIPCEKVVFVYGGNLGKPQGVPYILQCLHACRESENTYFLVVGDGTEYHLVDEYIKSNKPNNIKLMKKLPKEDYDTLVGACDVGMIFLDHRFTIPNYPSRVLSYMQAHLPVLACTDPNTDIGSTILEGKFGFWCESNDVHQFVNCVSKALVSNRKELGDNAFAYLSEKFEANKCCKTIMKHFKCECE